MDNRCRRGVNPYHSSFWSWSLIDRYLQGYPYAAHLRVQYPGGRARPRAGMANSRRGWESRTQRVCRKRCLLGTNNHNRIRKTHKNKPRYGLTPMLDSLIRRVFALLAVPRWRRAAMLFTVSVVSLGNLDAIATLSGSCLRRFWSFLFNRGIFRSFRGDYLWK